MNWITSPVVTELEIIVLDWLGKLLHLPEEFLLSCNATCTICILQWISMSYNSIQYLQIFFIFLLQFVGLWGIFSSQFCGYFPLRALKSWIAGKGGGVIQGTSSEAVLVAKLAACKCALKKVCTYQGMSEAEALTKLLVYTSDQAQSCVLREC
jgi:glutamate/tyrosine decarboxylase-like PLP-dependent enzyme